jgi:hypothetical protein
VRVLVLTAFLFGSLVSSAAAGPVPLEKGLSTVDQGLGAVGSVVESVTKPPATAPAPAPEPPVVGAKPPQPESVVREIARQPSPQPQPPRSVEPSQGSDPAASVPGPGSLSGTPGADVVATANAEAGRLTDGAPSPPVQVEKTADPNAASDPGVGRPGSIRAAMPAPLEEWLAHIWPAIALGPFGSALRTEVAALAPALLAGSLPGSVRLSSLGGAPTGPGPEPSAPAARAAQPDPTPFFSPHGGGMNFLVAVITVLASLVGLVALARLTVGEDFFSLRWLR